MLAAAQVQVTESRQAGEAVHRAIGQPLAVRQAQAPQRDALRQAVQAHNAGAAQVQVGQLPAGPQRLQPPAAEARAALQAKPLQAVFYTCPNADLK